MEGGPNFYNVAAADADGLEAELELRGGGTGLSLGWTWTRTAATDPGFDTGSGAEFADGAPLLRRPRHLLQASLQRRVAERATLRLDVRTVGARADRDFSTFPARRVELPRYTEVDLAADVRVGGGPGRGEVRLTLRGANLLDRRYEEALGFPAPGRRFEVGARLTAGGAG